MKKADASRKREGVSICGFPRALHLRVKAEAEWRKISLRDLYQQIVESHLSEIDKESQPAASHPASPSGEMNWVSGPEIGENLHASPALEDYTGCPAASFQGNGWNNLIHPDDREMCARNARDGFETRKPFWLMYRMRRKDGTFGLMLDHAVPRLRPDGSVAGYKGTLYEMPVSGPGIEIPVMNVESLMATLKLYRRPLLSQVMHPVLRGND